MKQKHLDYLAPEAEILVVRFEGVICNSPAGVSSPTFYENGDVDDSYSGEDWWN